MTNSRLQVPSAAGNEHTLTAAGTCTAKDGTGTDRCMWEGVNYTFDGRHADPLAGAHGRAGRCCYCGGRWHQLGADVVCAVCKDQILVCVRAISGGSRF